MATGFDWVAATGGIVAGVGGIASVVLALKSIKLTETAQKKVDEILEDDRRYHAFVDGKVQAGFKILNDDRGPRYSSKRGLVINEPANERYLARAVREGVFEIGDGSHMYWVTK
jgi:hypothetical protein